MNVAGSQPRSPVARVAVPAPTPPLPRPVSVPPSASRSSTPRSPVPVPRSTPDTGDSEREDSPDTQDDHDDSRSMASGFEGTFPSFPPMLHTNIRSEVTSIPMDVDLTLDSSYALIDDDDVLHLSGDEFGGGGVNSEASSLSTPASSSLTSVSMSSSSDSYLETKASGGSPGVKRKHVGVVGSVFSAHS